jgi:hypothetical protein
MKSGAALKPREPPRQRSGAVQHSRKEWRTAMKKVVYCVVVHFLAGGAMCNNQKPVVNNPPAQNADASKAPDRKPDLTKPETLSYANDIKPFLATHCIKCHGGDATKAGYNFNGFDGLTKGGKKGPAVVPGDPDKSLLVRVLSGEGKRMPPPMYKPQPQPEDVEMLKAWIAAGAKDDSAKGE